MRLRRCALGFGLWLRADPHRDRVCVITRPIPAGTRREQILGLSGSGSVAEPMGANASQRAGWRTRARPIDSDLPAATHSASQSAEELCLCGSSTASSTSRGARRHMRTASHAAAPYFFLFSSF